MKEENERQEKIKKEREEFKQALKSRKNITSSTVVSSEEILDENNEEILDENNEKKFNSGDETDPEVDPNIITRRPMSEEKIEEENLDPVRYSARTHVVSNSFSSPGFFPTEGVAGC